ncbi:helix-turn-helix transcriptional regulator [Marinoscillum sp. MHG1-6]|uniref:helix-turn-helix transcriptional regulator n=1 Tax=Marinoscillum sp. MHG1-6 TaxID=2959627 RepID=UPI0021573F70|nr:helix-turn-helix domain-containing protein [Marinoscillum sp. MHG1-6]
MDKLFGKNLKFLRSQKKLSQEQFALEIGLNRGNIASYEKGTAEPSVNNLLKIVKFFNIDLSDIVEKDLTLSNEFASELIEGGNSLTDKVDMPEEQMIEELEVHSKKMEKFLTQSNDMQKIVEGFKSFYLFKKAKGSVDMDRMVQEYENLLEVMESLLESHNELISFLEDKES